MKNIFSFVLLSFSFLIISEGIHAQSTEGYKLVNPKKNKANDVSKKSVAKTQTVVNGPKIEWMSWEEALEASKTTKKKIFVDVYTDWCGWCKKMDASTFVDAEVVAYMNENFYAVKLNAEQKEDIVFGEKTFKFVAGGRRGSHELAVELLNGRMGFPSFVLLNEDFARIRITPGFKQVPKLMSELTYAKDELYKLKTYDDYSFGL